MASATACPSPRWVELHGRSYKVGCGVRSCEGCGELWLGDTRVKVLAAAQALRGCVAIVTITAPGQDVLPFYSGTRLVRYGDRKAWNDSAPERWSKLHAGAARVVRRRAKDLGVKWRLLVKTWEFQKRGVLHLHLLVPAWSPQQLELGNLYVEELVKRAERAGFGFVDRGKLVNGGRRESARELSPVEPHRAAAYVASYFASGGAGKGGIQEVAKAQGVPGAIVYVTPVLTQKTGVTMRTLKNRRRVASRFPDAVADADSWHAACVCDAMERGHPPLTAADRGALLARAIAQRWAFTLDATTGEVREPTEAPAPGQPAGGHRSLSAASDGIAVRLDSVLHREDRDEVPVAYTRVSIVGPARIDRMRSSQPTA